ncbi:MAG: hypothetical protein WA944_22370 [Mycobacterium sp.]
MGPGVKKSIVFRITIPKRSAYSDMLSPTAAMINGTMVKASCRPNARECERPSP